MDIGHVVPLVAEKHKEDIEKGWRFILRSNDYKEILVFTPLAEIAVQDMEYIRAKWTNAGVFPYLVYAPEIENFREMPTTEYKEFLTNRPIFIIFFPFDLDLSKELRDKIKEKGFDPEYYSHFQLHLINLLKLRLQDEHYFTQGKTFTHLLIYRPQKHYSITLPLLDYIYEQYLIKIQKELPDWVHLDKWGTNYLHTKTTHPFYFVDFSYDKQIATDIASEIGFLYSNQEEKDPYKLARILPEMIKVFQEGNHEGEQIYGGPHNSFVILLAGELALAGYTEQEAIEIYENYFQPYDNPRDVRSRIATIRLTFQKYQRGEIIKAWRHLRPEWKLSRQKTQKPIAPSKDVMEQWGIKAYYELKNDEIIVHYLDSKGKGKGKKIMRKSLHWKWLMFPEKLETNKITFILKKKDGGEIYRITTPIPNTHNSKKEFETILSNYPLTPRDVKQIAKIIESIIALKEYYAFPQESQFNLENTKGDTDTGYENFEYEWKNNKAFRLGFTIALAKYQNPDLSNINFWIYGPTGVGKSYTLRALQQAFAGIQASIDTFNTLETMASISQGRTITIDDVAYYSNSPETIKNLIFAVWHGFGKGRRTSVAGSTMIYKNQLSATVFYAYENHPEMLFSKKEIGTLRRMLIYHFQEKITPNPNPAPGIGYALYFGKVEPAPITNDVYIPEYEIRQYYPYVVALYQIFNVLFQTDFRPDVEFQELVEHHTQMIRNNQIIAERLAIEMAKEILTRKKQYFYRWNQKIYLLNGFIKTLANDLRITPEQIKTLLKNAGCTKEVIKTDDFPPALAWDITPLWEIYMNIEEENDDE